MLLGQAIAKVISEDLDVPYAIAVEIVADMRLMNDDLDAAFEDDSDNTEEVARTLYERMTLDPRIVNWLEGRAAIVRAGLDTPAS
jgi:hypothetical protein